MQNINIVRRTAAQGIQERMIESQQERDYTVRVVLFIAFHIVLALWFKADKNISTLHALLTLGVGMFFLLKESSPAKVIYVIAYISGAELLWRGTNAAVFWEYGKYATILLLVLVILKYHLVVPANKTMLVYFVLLLPSIIFLPAFDREAISFYLAGPLALALAMMVFSCACLSFNELRNIFFAILAPVVGLGALALFSTLSTGPVAFATAYGGRLTSVGIGQNQFSSILGMGALVAFLYSVNERRYRLLRWVSVGLSVWLMAQAALSFSRGGVWAALISAGIAGFHWFRDKRARGLFLVVSSVIFLITYFIIFPALEKYTENTIHARFESLELTGRDLIMQADLLIFQENLLLGVGPGQSRKLHTITFRDSLAHTEFTRLLAEHGLFGLVALVLLFWVTAMRVFGSIPSLAKGFVLAFTFWTLLFMFHAATRLVAPSFLFGLAAAQFVVDETNF